jgi:hypothetical protein
MECLGLHNKPKAAVHPELLPTGPLEEEEEVTRLLCPATVAERSCFMLWMCLSVSASLYVRAERSKQTVMASRRATIN